MPTVQRMKAKVALIGDSSVGKTSLIRRFVLDEYDDSYLHTVGTKVTKLELTVPHGPDTDVEVDLAIFDVMGQPGFLDMIKDTFFFGAQGLVAVCDITRSKTLAAIHDWMQTATNVAGDVPGILMVNKMDLAEKQRAFPDSEVEKVGAVWEVPIAYTSAKTGAGVVEAFNTVAIAMVVAAFREGESRAREENLRSKVLDLIARRHPTGMSKKELFGAFPGVSYGDLERELTKLEREAMVQLNWTGPTDFSVRITPVGERAARET